MDSALPEISNSVPCDDCSNADFDLILQHWKLVAATGWFGFLLHDQRGVVMVEIQDDDVIELSFHPGSPCPCHQELVASYDPTECVVVGVVRGDQAVIYPVQGYPLPEMACGLLPVDALPFTRH